MTNFRADLWFRCKSAEAPAAMHAPLCTPLGQRDELELIARNLAEMALLPLVFGLFDAFAPRRDEVPPQMTWAIEHLAPDHGEPARCQGLDRNAISGAEHQQPSVGEAVAGDVDLPRFEV